MNKKLIISLVLLLVALAVILLYVFRDKIFKGNTQTNNGTTAPPEFPLQRGSDNDYVMKYQEYLIQKGNCLPNFGADGNWGNETENCSMQVTGKNSVTWDEYKKLGLA